MPPRVVTNCNLDQIKTFLLKNNLRLLFRPQLFVDKITNVADKTMAEGRSRVSEEEILNGTHRQTNGTPHPVTNSQQGDSEIRFDIRVDRNILQTSRLRSEMYIPLSEREVISKTAEMVGGLFVDVEVGYLKMFEHDRDTRDGGEIALTQSYRIFQNVSQAHLEYILHYINEKRFHYNLHAVRDLLSLHSSLYILTRCCSTTAAVKRVMDFPEIMLFVMNTIEAGLECALHPEDPVSDLHPILGSAFSLVGKFMAFPEKAPDIFTWWDNMMHLYGDTIKAGLKIAPDQIRRTLATVEVGEFGISNMCNAFQRLQYIAKHITETLGGMVTQPAEIIALQNEHFKYGVFCSSLKCSVLVDRDGVLRHCARCKLAPYCSRECQRYHWKHGHKEQCWKRD